MNTLATFLGSLEQPVWLIGALVLPLLVGVLLAWRDGDRRRRLARLGNPETVRRILPPPPRASTRGRMALLAGVTAFAGIAWAGPRWGTEQTSIRTAGADVAIAVDASLSMLATDERPSRLERAKEDVRRLRALAPGDRTALIAFAGRSYTLTPLTVDNGAIALYLDNLDPSVVGQPGTSLSRAITQGTDMLLASPTASDRALVIMSDGEGFESEDEVRAAAARAGDNGISLITVGYGTEEGSTIPIHTANGVTVKRNDMGAVVVTRYSPVLLAAAAEAAHGTFIPAATTDKAANIRRALAKLRVARRALQASDQRSPRFQLFLLPALLLLFADTLLSESRAAPGRRSGVRVAPGPNGKRTGAGEDGEATGRAAGCVGGGGNGCRCRHVAGSACGECQVRSRRSSGRLPPCHRPRRPISAHAVQLRHGATRGRLNGERDLGADAIRQCARSQCSLSLFLQSWPGPSATGTRCGR